jgi:hypothetical protein
LAGFSHARRVIDLVAKHKVAGAGLSLLLYKCG